MSSAAAAGLLTGLSLIIAIGAQNAFVLRQGLARQYVGPVVAVCALSDAALIVAGVSGIGAVVELTRVLALSIGSPAVNTRARIEAARQAGVLGDERADDLRDAFEFVSYVRLRHQAAQLRRGEQPDSFVAPRDLSSFDKRHLREAFAIVRSAQSALGNRYPASYIS